MFVCLTSSANAVGLLQFKPLSATASGALHAQVRPSEGVRGQSRREMKQLWGQSVGHSGMETPRENRSRAHWGEESDSLMLRRKH